VLERTRLAAGDAGTALGVQAPPAEPAAQVGRVDRVETQMGIPVEDPLTDVQPVVVLLETLGRVQRLTVAQGPLAVATPGFGWHVAGPFAASGPRRPHANCGAGSARAGRTGSAAGTTDGAAHAQEVHVTATHERHPAAAANGVCHNDASSSSQR